MTVRDFRFELFAEGGMRRWRVLAGEIFCATLEWERGPIGSGCEWRLYSVSSPDSASRGVTWPRGEWIAPRSVPLHIKQKVIEEIAAWGLDALAEAAQANAELRLRLESSTAKLAAERDILRESLLTEDGRYDDETDIEIVAEFDREIAANTAALARTRTEDKEGA